MMKKKWTGPSFLVQQVDLNKIGDVDMLSNDELKERMIDAGYKFRQANSVEKLVKGEEIGYGK